MKPDWTSRCGTIQLYNADCRDVLPTLEAGDHVGIVTDPNYGIQAAKAKAHSSIRDNDDWSTMTWDDDRPSRELFDMLLRFNAVAIWGGNYFADLLPASSGWLAWIKPEAETGFSLADMELCWTNQSFAGRVRRFPRRDGHLHPTQKPVQVMRWTLSFIKSPVIIDPFMGSATTAIACFHAERRFIGIEREKSYFDVAVERCEAELSRAPLFTPPTPNQTTMFEDVKP